MSVLFLNQSEAPSLMPGLVVKSVLCLGLINIKSDSGSTVQERDGRNLQTSMEHTDLPPSTWHRKTIDTHQLLLCNAAQMEDVTQPTLEATTLCEFVVVKWERKRGGSLSIIRREGMGDLMVERSSLL